MAALLVQSCSPATVQAPAAAPQKAALRRTAAPPQAHLHVQMWPVGTPALLSAAAAAPLQLLCTLPCRSRTEYREVCVRTYLLICAELVTTQALIAAFLPLIMACCRGDSGLPFLTILASASASKQLLQPRERCNGYICASAGGPNKSAGDMAWMLFWYCCCCCCSCGCCMPATAAICECVG
jgi:hypothetical protein